MENELKNGQRFSGIDIKTTINAKHQTREAKHQTLLKNKHFYYEKAPFIITRILSIRLLRPSAFLCAYKWVGGLLAV